MSSSTATPSTMSAATIASQSIANENRSANKFYSYCNYLTTVTSTLNMASTDAGVNGAASGAAVVPVTETTVQLSAKPPTLKFNSNVGTFLTCLNVYFGLNPSLAVKAKIASCQVQLDDSRSRDSSRPQIF